jgi:hypothetical protein
MGALNSARVQGTRSGGCRKPGPGLLYLDIARYRLPRPVQSAQLSARPGRSNRDRYRRLNLRALSDLPDEEIIEVLTAVPGIGPWTAQGALIIALDREDVVLPGDLALRRAIQTTY